MAEESAGVTRLLLRWRDGDRAALDALTPIVYQELRRLARYYISRERQNSTLQPTALIHEAFMRLVDQNVPAFECRSHFFRIASQVMRQVLIDFARRRKATKRDGGEKVELDDSHAISVDQADRFLMIHEALGKLKDQDSRKADVIEMKYFGGFSREEIAESLGLTLATVKRDIMLGEAFLRRELAAAGIKEE